MVSTQQQQAAALLLERRKARRDLVSWAQVCGFEPALHHRLILTELENVVEGRTKNLMIMTPPGSAKSTYASVLFPPWFLCRKPNSTILACSYAYQLIEQFGRKCRNLIAQRAKWLGYDLRVDSKAAGEWEVTNGGRYFCAGTNAGIAGHRADLAVIDDPIGSDADAFSKNYRENQWSWYWNDFWPRLKPEASQILICNRRHFDDLPGRLLAKEPEKWKVIKLPFFAEEGDVLGRPLGARLWPEWFTEAMEAIIREHPNLSGLYQQNPLPETGEFFKREWIDPYLYDADELPKDGELRFYVGSDHAVSQDQAQDRSCFVPVGVDNRDVLWVMPDVFWKRCDTGEAVDAMLGMMKRRRPLCWWAGRDQITGAIGPFLTKRMQEERVYTYIEEVSHVNKRKRERAQSIQGRLKMGMVRLPRYAPWFSEAMNELLTFDMGVHDDFVDALSEVGRGLARMVAPPTDKVERVWNPVGMDTMSMKWLKKQDAESKQREAALRSGY